jgi:hypothetical protein
MLGCPPLVEFPVGTVSRLEDEIGQELAGGADRRGDLVLDPVVTNGSSISPTRVHRNYGALACLPDLTLSATQLAALHLCWRPR